MSESIPVNSIKWTHYIQEEPFPKQLVMLLLNNKEAFFGGAAGGGKSSYLLQAALQYVDVPGYSAIIIRQSFMDLAQPGGLISRSHEWLTGTGAKWNGTEHKWTFPTSSLPATLQFGYMASYADKYKYQGSQYQYVGFDEAVQFSKESYLYLFSRVRRPRCGKHYLDPQPDRCQLCLSRMALANVPLRVRAASNPPAMVQGQWVKERFRVAKVGDIYRGTHPTRPYVPSFIEDNPAIDPKEYMEYLAELDPVTRAQLMSGDWGAYVNGRYKPVWFAGRTWSRQSDSWLIGTEGTKRASVTVPNQYNYRFCNMPGIDAPPKEDAKRTFPEHYHTSELQFFCMIDPAATIRDGGPGDADIYVRKEPSWTVIGLFALTPKGDLLVCDIIRFQREIPDVILAVHGALKRWQRSNTLPMFVGVEANGVGKAVYQQLQQDGVPVVDCSRHTVDKLVYATPSINMAAKGQIYVPLEGKAHWLEPFLKEITGFTGHPTIETNDQVDTLSHAGQFAHSRALMGSDWYPPDLADAVGHYD